MTDELNPNPTTSSPTSSTTPPQPNEPGARSPDGTILDVSASPSVSESVQSNSPAQPNAGAPESYSDFSVPDGVTLDPSLVSEVTPIFKELGLDQTAAQRLVDTWAKQQKSAESALIQAVETTRAKFVADTKADPVIGTRLEEVRTDINRALTHLPADVVTQFKNALDFTGAGDHPGVIRAVYELSKLVNEGRHITGAGPSAHGQQAAGKVTPPSAAAALYPNLPPKVTR